MKRLILIFVVLLILFPRQMGDILAPVADAVRAAWQRTVTEQGR